MTFVPHLHPTQGKFAAMVLPQYNLDFLISTATAAKAAGHIFPDFAACEAGLESGFGHSALAHDDNNLFGTKQHKHPIFGTHNLPTKEFLHGSWEVVNAAWIRYPSLADCFADRMATLRRLAPEYPHYARALAATDGTGFVSEVSQTWSTDPNRAKKVFNISSGWSRSGF